MQNLLFEYQIQTNKNFKGRTLSVLIENKMNETKKLFEKPQHPYTKNLLSSIPNIGGKRVIETFTPMGAPPDQVEYLNKGNNA